jgi:hypothetical protein
MNAPHRMQAMVIMPAQFFRPGAWSVQPELRLMEAVLEEAVRTYRACEGRTDRRGRLEFRDVARWFASDDTKWPFSFVNICDTIGIDIDRLRQELGRHPARGGADAHASSRVSA